MGKKKAANGQHFNLRPKIVAVCRTKTLEFNTRLIDHTELLYPSIALYNLYNFHVICEIHSEIL